jgi:UDP-N-acetylmuramoyl-L-alanyl-D-glutamate--2,6-diaminopimelate ligase
MLIPEHYPVTCDSRRVGPGSTFVAIPGFTTNGTVFIPKALAQGATRIVLATKDYTHDIAAMCQQHGATVFLVENPRAALADLAAEALDYPAKKLSIIGITGTKGKSTTTMLIAHLLEASGHKVALINTIYNSICGEREKSTHTTPEADYLQLFFATCVERGVTHVIMEVSSHALSLSRTRGIVFKATGFTNLAPEHLDFYNSMEEYFAAKASIFMQTDAQSIIAINADNEWSAQAIKAAKEAVQKTHAAVTTFGLEGSSTPSDCCMVINTASADGIKLSFIENLVVECPQLFGSFNCYNIAMAILIAAHCGMTHDQIKSALSAFPGVPGRLQRHILKNGARTFVDYAHNPSSMGEVLKTLRPFTSHLIVVFGCGGDRDTTKRPVMGSIAALYADRIIITNDNPRTEEPAAIITQIMAGIPADKQPVVTSIQDRRAAIALAAQEAHPHSIIALLGKGHEDYYLIGNQRTHLDDLQEIKQF